MILPIGGPFSFWLAAFSQNIAMGMVLIFIYSALRSTIRIERRLVESLIIGALFGCSAVASMTFPVRTSDGLSIDARTVFVLVGGLFGGPVGAAIGATATSIYRFWIGGPAALPGVVTIVITGLFASVIAWRYKERARELRVYELAAIGLCNTLLITAALRIVHYFLGGPELPIAGEIAGFVVFPLGAVLLGAAMNMVHYRMWTRIRLQMEENLRRSEERFALAMRGANEGLWDWNLLTGEVYYSPRWKAMLGYDESELAGTIDTFTQLIHPDDLKPVLDLDPSVVHEGPQGEMEVEFRLRHKDGHYVNILAHSLPVYDDKGQRVRLVGTHQDITTRKKQEQQLRQAAMVFNSTQEGVVVTDASGAITAINPAVTRITGYDEAALLGQSLSALLSPREGRDIFEHAWAAILHRGNWQGEITGRRRDGETFPAWLTISAVHEDDGALVNAVATFIDITQVKESEARLEHLAHHDPLTGLPNRVVLVDRLGHAISHAKRGGTRGAVLFLDLDRFKNINDSLGHPAGDELLEQVARRLRSRLRDTDTLARLGGDEFVVLLEALADPEDAARVAQSLINQVATSFLLSGGREVYVGTSIGITLFPDDGDTANQLIQNADAALYQAKDSGRNTYRFFTSEMTRAAIDRLEMEARLRRALERGEFVLHYQPVVALADRRVVGVEALVRWQEPGRGLVPPGKFIPIAEETGLILPLGHWVLRAACSQMEAWREKGVALETIAVNLSPLQFNEPDLEERVSAILAATGLPPQCLELEITEGVLMGRGGEAEAKLNKLRSLGVRLAIDDFGTGYSSLAYLKRFPIDRLKVDQSFVRGIPEDRADMEITAAIIAMAKNLRLEVLAEGVETPEQLAFLTEHGCDSGQGFLFSRPLPKEELEDTLGKPAPALRRTQPGRTGAAG